MLTGLAGAPAVADVDWVGVPADPLVPMAFEEPANWNPAEVMPVPAAGQETAPPGPDSLFFIGSPFTVGETMYDGIDVTIELTQERSGNNGTLPLGTMAIGNGAGNQVQTLIISTDVTFTGQERAEDGSVAAGLRGLRVGREDTSLGNGEHPWGVVVQTAGSVSLGGFADAEAASIKLSGDNKAPNGAAGSIWEVGGAASLSIQGPLWVGGFNIQPESPGSVFRVRGSQVGQIDIGTDFEVSSNGGLWDIEKLPSGQSKFNQGKSIAEFVLDASGVGTVVANDELRIGELIPAFGSPTGQTEFSLGFLRIKLSEPTTAGSGAVDSGDDLVLFEADRISSQIAGTGTPLDDGRFFDPDRPGATGPHRPMFDPTGSDPLHAGQAVADYAGATWTWTISYIEQPGEGAAGNDIIDSYVVLSDLVISGLPGDLNGDSMVGEPDYDMLAAAIASPPVTHYDLLGAAQHLFDLNADDFIDDLDLAVFEQHFFAPDTDLDGDYNGDGKVDAADYVVWRKTDGNNPAGYNTWRENFGAMAGAGAGSSRAASAAPEPGAMILVLFAAIGATLLRRRAY